LFGTAGISFNYLSRNQPSKQGNKDKNEDATAEGQDEEEEQDLEVGGLDLDFERILFVFKFWWFPNSTSRIPRSARQVAHTTYPIL